MESTKDFACNYERARQCFHLGDFEQSRIYFESARAQINPRDTVAESLFWEYGLCLHENGDYMESFTTVQQGLAFFPDCRQLYLIKGKILYELGLLNQSRICFQKGTSLKVPSISPNDVSPDRSYWFLAAIAARLGEEKEALRCFRLFIMENPPLNALLKLYLLLEHLKIEIDTLIYNLLEESELSSLNISSLLTIIKEHKIRLTETNGEVNQNIGTPILNQGFDMETRVWLERSSYLEGSPEYYCMLGIANSRAGHYEQAIEYFLQAMVLDPQNPIYPCFAFEVQAVHAMKILVRSYYTNEYNPVLINELLRLCTIKSKSMRIRHSLAVDGNDAHKSRSVCSHLNILSIVDDVDEEEVWNLND